jgi:ABC-type dipeptide/oligopeptide/nickel transport system permease component
MLTYLIRRVLILIPVWLGIITLTFLMRAVVPGDPVENMFFGKGGDPKVIQNIRVEMGLDKPLYEQYIKYILDVSHGDLGKSILTRRPVIDEIGDRYLKTITLALSSLAVALVVGLTLGILAALFKDSIIDTGTTILALVGLSMPAFWLGLLFINLFAVQLRWISLIGPPDFPHLILPSLTLGLIYAAVLMRLVRSSLLEVLNQDYIRTARSKGLATRLIMVRHALKNALIPVVTILGLQFGALLGGAFVVENVFVWPGVGQLIVNAINQRDFPIIQGIVLLVATTYVLVNLVVDLLYHLLDPRINARKGAH